MSKTRADIQFKTLAILTGGDVGQVPSADDASAIDGYIDDVVEELSADGTTFIYDPDELPEALFLTFCKMVANAAADEFGATSDENRGAMLRNRMRVLTRQVPGYGAQVVSYF